MYTQSMRRKVRAALEGPIQVVGYVRVSTEKQTDSGAGIEAQRRTIEAECERRGWQLEEIVEDDGFSGKSLKRPGLQGAIQMLARGERGALMVAKLDRLSRSVKDFCELVDMSRHDGWKLVVLDCNVDTSTPAGEMLAGVMAQFAQFERRMIGLRTKEALAVKRSQGVVLGRRPEVAADVEKRIGKMRRDGATLAAIADRLNSDGVATARGGARWYASTVLRVAERAVPP